MNNFKKGVVTTKLPRAKLAASQRQPAATVNDPIVEPRARQVSEMAPPNLVANPDVLREFLNPPAMRGDWFSNTVWQEASGLAVKDVRITADQYQDLIARMNTIQEALITWTEKRPAMPHGFAETVSPDMRFAGTTAWNSIRDLCRGPITELSRSIAPERETRDALTSLGEVLNEYLLCMVYELEASYEKVPVMEVRDRCASRPGARVSMAAPRDVGQGGIASSGTGDDDSGTGDAGTGDGDSGKGDGDSGRGDGDSGTGDAGTGEGGGIEK